MRLECCNDKRNKGKAINNFKENKQVQMKYTLFLNDCNSSNTLLYNRFVYKNSPVYVRYLILFSFHFNVFD